MEGIEVTLVYNSNTIRAVYLAEMRKEVKGELNLLFSLLSGHMGANYNQRF